MTEFRPIASEDWAAIDGVQRASFPPTAIETVEALSSIAAVAPEWCFVADDGGRIVGYVLAHPWVADDLPALNHPLTECPPGANALFIHDTAILPTARGGGLASRMVRHLLERAVRAGLERVSLLSVQGTVDFWSRFGFVERPELTERFRERVFGFYEIDFHFMTALLSQDAFAPGNHFAR